jgi:hypothetical protein
MSRTQALARYKIQGSSILHFVPFQIHISKKQDLAKSLILAQDERWRRG